MQLPSSTRSSDRHALALAALTALGSDLVAMRGRVSRIFTDSDIVVDGADGAGTGIENLAVRNRSKGSVKSRRRLSTSSKGSAKRSSRSISSSSCSSCKSLSKASRSKSKGKQAARAKSTMSRASNSKTRTVGSSGSAGERERRRTTVLTVSARPKPEKYVPPPRGTFRTSYTRQLRSDVIGELVSEIENLGMPEAHPALIAAAADRSGLSPEGKDVDVNVNMNAGPSTLPAAALLQQQQQPQPQKIEQQQQQQQQDQALIKRPVQPPPVPLTSPLYQLTLQDLPSLGLAEFDFFSASRSRSSDVKETSPVWCRSPAAPAPPRVRRWLKNARKQPTGTLEEMADDSSSQGTGTSRGGSGT